VVLDPRRRPVKAHGAALVDEFFDRLLDRHTPSS
jgi:hypothetical protein